MLLIHSVHGRKLRFDFPQLRGIRMRTWFPEKRTRVRPGEVPDFLPKRLFIKPIPQTGQCKISFLSVRPVTEGKTLAPAKHIVFRFHQRKKFLPAFRLGGKLFHVFPHGVMISGNFLSWMMESRSFFFGFLYNGQSVRPAKTVTDPRNAIRRVFILMKLFVVCANHIEDNVVVNAMRINVGRNYKLIFVSQHFLCKLDAKRVGQLRRYFAGREGLAHPHGTVGFSAAVLFHASAGGLLRFLLVQIHFLRCRLRFTLK